ncbi:MAG: TonB-dependent receptor plug domain-containing protein [candidate division WOR-3 bacterium]
MKKCVIFIFIFFSLMKSFSSYVYVYDKNSGEKIYYVTVSSDNKPYQTKTPFEIEKGKEITVSSLGYRSLTFKVLEETLRIYLEIEPFTYKPLVIEKERINGEVLKLETKNKNPVSIIKKIPSVTLREYNRNYVISVDGLLNEDNQICVDGVPIVNQQSRTVPINLLPKNIFSTISFYKNGISNFYGENIFSSGINFEIEKLDRSKVNINFDDKKSYDVDLTLSFKGLKIGNETFDKSDMVIPEREKILNSYQKGYLNYLYFNNNFFSTLMIDGKIKTGDPGILGHRFYNSTIYEKNRIINFKFLTAKNLKILYSHNLYTYIYDNKDLIIYDTSKTSSNNIIVNYNDLKNDFGLFFQNNSIVSTKVLFSNEFFYGIFSNFVIKSFEISNSFSISSTWKKDNFKNNFVYSFSILKMFNFNEYLVTHSLKISTRRPTFNELYWTGDIFTRGNEKLVNEKLYSYHFAFSKEDKKFLGGFNFYKDLIRWININGIYTPENILKTYNPYIGFQYNKNILNFNNSLVFTISPMYLDRFKILLYTSFINLNYSLSYEFKNLIFSLYFEYRSKRFLNNENTKYLPPYFCFDEVSLDYRLKSLYVTLSIDNPFDLKIESVRGYIKEGRKFSLNFKMEV